MTMIRNKTTPPTAPPIGAILACEDDVPVVATINE